MSKKDIPKTIHEGVRMIAKLGGLHAEEIKSQGKKLMDWYEKVY